MAKKIVSFLMVVFLVNNQGVAASIEIPPYEKYVDEIINEVAYEAKREFGLYCDGSGGRMPKSVETIFLSFDVCKRGTIQEARELMVSLKNKLVKKVNSHKKIQPYLKKSPFSWAEADISISFSNEDDSFNLDDSVAFVCSAREGMIAYKATEIQKRETPGVVDCDGRVMIPRGAPTDIEVFVTILRESEEEALRLAQLKQFVK